MAGMKTFKQTTYVYCRTIIVDMKDKKKDYTVHLLHTVYVQYFTEAIIELFKVNACLNLRINLDSKI